MMSPAMEQVRALFGLTGERWTLPVLSSLRGGKLRFGEVQRAVSGVSQKQLTHTLRSLERDGFVERTAYMTIPPRVEYQLTELGRTLTGPLDNLWNWAAEHMGSVSEARANYDRVHEAASEPKPERRYAGAAN